MAAVTLFEIYSTRLTDLNHCSLYGAGVELYADPARLRRLYLRGLEPFDALKRLHGQR